MGADGVERWVALNCPICRGLAWSRQAAHNTAAIACQSCGTLHLSPAAADVLRAVPALHRSRLSATVRDACQLTEGGPAVIDGAAAAALVAIAALSSQTGQTRFH